MGSGDIFRAVAQALQSGAQFPLDESERRQKNAQAMALAQMQKTPKERSPLEEALLLAQINKANRANAGGGGSGGGNDKLDNQIESIIREEETGRGSPFDAQTRATIKRRMLEGHLIKLSGTSLDARPDLANPFANLPALGQAEKLGVQPAPAVPAQPPTTSLPPRKPGETQEQYSARTGIKFK